MNKAINKTNKTVINLTITIENLGDLNTYLESIKGLVEDNSTKGSVEYDNKDSFSWEVIETNKGSK